MNHGDTRAASGHAVAGRFAFQLLDLRRGRLVSPRQSV